MYTKVTLKEIQESKTIKLHTGDTVHTLDDVILGALDGCDYGQGHLEDLSKSIDKVSIVLSRLIRLLKEKQLLSDENVLEIIEYLF